jgi:parvulin-like peptidyl-prolyl isomerase
MEQRKNTMSDLDQITALQIYGADVSLSTVLKTLRVAGKKRFLRAAAEELVTQNAAKALGIEIGDADLQEAADEFRRDCRLISSDATNAWLERQGWKVEEFEQHVERKLIRSRVVETIASPELIEAHFAEHRRAYDQAQLGRIVVESESLAQEILAQINDDGADFSELARRHSTDTSSARVGGTLGLAERTTLPTSLEALVFAAEDGDVVGPVQTDDGFELMKVDRLLLGTLDKNVTEAIRFDLFSQWVADQMREADVSYQLFEMLD